MKKRMIRDMGRLGGSCLVVRTERWYCSRVSLGYNGVLAFEGSRQGRCHFCCPEKIVCDLRN